ncbi:hypothetical protein NC652_036688 [Populus alba x Populus x berolinensis]|nr:hypothetical protein NC652_036688 [Populus alba x Populus x berolinensis]
MHIVCSLVRFCMVQFWACMLNFFSYMHFYVLKIVVGPATLSCILPVFGAHDFSLCFVATLLHGLCILSSRFTMASGLFVLRVLAAICLWSILLVC